LRKKNKVQLVSKVLSVIQQNNNVMHSDLVGKILQSINFFIPNDVKGKDELQIARAYEERLRMELLSSLMTTNFNN